ncbi:histone-lysine N-methyltransferase SETMAR [Trichonephila clavipes]|nr:histone-lysine N-methyltransferase SETMAR [Trichonephila clavipes]
MVTVIESPSKCQIRSDRCFLTARNISAAGIHHQITEVYDTEAINESKFEKFKLKDGRTKVHDDERSDRSSVITDDLMRTVETKIQVLDHAPHSPGLDPIDFHLFRYLKRSLGGKRLNDNEEVNAAVNSWLSDQAADFFEEGFQTLVLRHNKCINKLGNCAEKSAKVCTIQK